MKWTLDSGSHSQTWLSMPVSIHKRCVRLAVFAETADALAEGVSDEIKHKVLMRKSRNFKEVSDDLDHCDHGLSTSRSLPI